MRKLKKLKVFPLNVEELQRLSETDSGIVLRTNCRCHLKLNYSALPIGSQQFKDAITEELNKRVLRYNSDLNDMILKYCNIRVITPIEAGRSRKLDMCCLADIYVFKPRCDSILTGRVNKKSKDHLGCIIYDVFNVSIMKPQDIPYNQWPGRHINIDDEITFKVVKVDISEVIPYIVGELEPTTNDETNDEGDSVISTDHNSQVTSEFSDLEDVIETIKDVKSKKRKLSDKFPEEISKKKRKLA